MNILYLLQRYPGFGGIEVVTKLITRELCLNYGHNIVVFSTSFQIEPSQILSIPNWKYITSELKGERLISYFNQVLEENSIQIIVYQDSYIPDYFLLENLDKEKYKIIVCEHNVPNCLEIGLKYVTLHTPCNTIANIYRKLRLPFRYRTLHKNARQHHRHLLKLSDKYVLLSETFKQILEDEYGIVSNKIISITNPVQCCTTNIVKKEKIVLFVGRLTSQKGIEFLMKIWKRIETIRPDWKLLIIGDGDLREYIDSFILKHGLKNISREGFKSDVTQYYSKSSALFMTSIFEGFGLVLAEAMSYGTIPFAFNSFASVTDIIDNQKNGFIIEPFNLDSYVDKFLEFSAEDFNVFRMQNESVEKSKCFNPKYIASLWDDLFKSLFNS